MELHNTRSPLAALDRPMLERPLEKPVLDDRDEETGAQRAGPWLIFTSYARLLVGGAGMALGVMLFSLLLIVCMPSRALRVRISNVYGSVFGRWMFFCSGSSLSVDGLTEARARGPAIWAMNHSSLLDIPLGIWLSPPGTVGVGKREVIYYPFFGVLYLLSGHLRIDRRVSSSSVAAMRKLATWVNSAGLSIFIWPEGTRSPDGRLRAMKKGMVHLALQTGLPIQPMVTSGIHRAWPKGAPCIRPTRVRVCFPPPIDTTAWREETIEAHLAEVETAFIDVLPPDQRPLAPLRGA